MKKISTVKSVFIAFCIIIIFTSMYYMLSCYYERFETTTIESLKKDLETTTSESGRTAIKAKLVQALNTRLTQLTDSLTAKSNEQKLQIRYQIADNLREQLLYTTADKRDQIQSQYDANRTEIAKLSPKQNIKNTGSVSVPSDPGLFNDTSIDPSVKRYIDKEVASVVPMTMERFT